jgi:hypothetical protein
MAMNPLICWVQLHFGPLQSCPFISAHFVIICGYRNLFVVEEKDPMAAFMYGLRAPDTRRQYPRRFQYLLNFLSIPGTLEEQAKQSIFLHHN